MSGESLDPKATQLASFVSSAPISVAMFDNSMNYVAVSRRFLSDLGLPAAEKVVGRSQYDVLPEVPQRWRDIHVRVLSGEEIACEEDPFERGDGRVDWFRWSMGPWFKEDGAIGGALLYSEIRTKEIEARHALETSERRLRVFYEAGLLGVVFWDTAGRITDANDKFLQMIGYSREDLVKGHIDWKKMTPPEYRPLDSLAVEQMRDTGVCQIFEKEYFRTDGSRVPVLLAGVTLDERRVDGVAFVLDISKQKNVEKALHESHRQKDEFLALLAHELRNPLAPIRNAVEILRRVSVTDPIIQRARDLIDRQTTHLTRIVDDLLDLSRINGATLRLQSKLLDLAIVVRQSSEDHRAILAERGLTLHIDIPDEPVWIVGDETRIAQMLGNLLHNAQKFTEAGGSVEVALHTVIGSGVKQAAFSVRDTGKGIARDKLPRVFDMFATETGYSERSMSGLGLGLALVKGLADLHGGNAEVESAGPGRGTEVKVMIPVAKPHLGNDCDVIVEPKPTAIKRRRILIIEDNEDVADSLKMYLELAGHTVETASTGEAGIVKAGVFQPDCVLSDLGLPGINGCDVARAIRAEPSLKHLYLVALSGYGAETDRLRAIDAGFNEHLNKPLDPDRFFQLLNRELKS